MVAQGLVNEVILGKVPHKSVMFVPKVPHENVVFPPKVPHKNVILMVNSLFFIIFVEK